MACKIIRWNLRGVWQMRQPLCHQHHQPWGNKYVHDVTLLYNKLPTSLRGIKWNVGSWSCFVYCVQAVILDWPLSCASENDLEVWVPIMGHYSLVHSAREGEWHAVTRFIIRHTLPTILIPVDSSKPLRSLLTAARCSNSNCTSLIVL